MKRGDTSLLMHSLCAKISTIFITKHLVPHLAGQARIQTEYQSRGVNTSTVNYNNTQDSTSCSKKKSCPRWGLTHSTVEKWNIDVLVKVARHPPPLAPLDTTDIKNILYEETHQASPGHEEPGNKESVDAVGQFPGKYHEELGVC